jgi:metal-sulfur cluster biosynthetic enzyme
VVHRPRDQYLKFCAYRAGPVAGDDDHMSASPATVPGWALDALADVYDPCCREKGISVVDMGLVRSVHTGADGRIRVELLLTTGWCPFATRLLTDVRDSIAAQPGVDADAVDVDVVWDEPWTTDRLSPRARSLLRFLPPPAEVPDRDAYLARHMPTRGEPR